MFNKIAAATAALVFIAAASAVASPQTKMVTMRAENKSGEKGTARLMQLPRGVQILITLTGAPSNPQPAHIHAGTCQKLNPAPEIPLSDVVNGTSKTFLTGRKLSDLTGGKYSINVHKSANELAIYSSCGAIK